MTTTNQYCCVLSRIYPKPSFCVVFFVLALTTINCVIHKTSAQVTASAEMELTGPGIGIVDEEFGITVNLVNPSNVRGFLIALTYPSTFNYVSTSWPERITNQNRSVRDLSDLGDKKRLSVLLVGSATPANISAGEVFTLNFVATEAGTYSVEIVDADVSYTDNNYLDIGIQSGSEPRVKVDVSPPPSGTVAFYRPSVPTRINVPSSVEIRLVDRKGLHHYSITVDPSENLGSISVAYASDDTEATPINNHTAGDLVTISATLTDRDTDGLYSGDSTVAALLFTPTDTSDTEATLEITEAKFYVSDTDTTGIDATLPSTNPLTFEIAEARDTITTPTTGLGPTVVFTLFEPGTKQGPFDIDVSFKSENLILYQINADASVGVQRGVIGIEPSDIIVEGSAGAFLTGKLWTLVGDNGALARITPTRTGTVKISVPAGAVTEVGTGLPNVASDVFRVNVELDYPPWDVNEDGSVDQTDVDLVEAAIGQGLHQSIGNGGVWTDSSIENARTDVNGDMYVTEADVQMVKDNFDDGVQGSSERSTEEKGILQRRSVEEPPPEPDASVWMPDAKLRKCVRKKLKLTDDTELTQAEMANLSKLSCKKKGISDITGLEYATNLKSLNLLGNNISDLTALEGLTNLTYLNIKENLISNIAPLGNLTKLTELWMTNNDVEDISPLSNLVELRVLRMSGNPVLDLSPLYPLIQGKLKWYGGLDVPRYPPWDVNQDGSVDATDVALVTAALGQTGDNILAPRMDVNGDGTVDNTDLTLVTDNLDTDTKAPSISVLSKVLDPEMLERLDRETLQSYLSALRAENDGSLKYRRAIGLLEGLLAATRPLKTLLLANYPNPFNPETWIPYHLANASDVEITIYDMRGQVVQRLDLGYQTAGRYTLQSRAAYWDGRNDAGERVASGIYFYQLRADNISPPRKLLILK